LSKHGVRRMCVGILFSLPLFAQVTVSTHHYDNSRTGLNSDESILTASNVNSSQFGMVGSFAVDGQVYSQPLYIPNVSISNKGTYNVLYVATMNNSVYAFDADASTTTVLWQKNYNNAAANVTPVPYTDVEISSETDINGPIGIEGTPVIDVPNSTMYFVVRTKESGSYVQRLHAIDIRSGAEMTGSPVVITASVKNSSGVVLTFNSKTQNQRVPLALANNMVYITWASHNDIPPYFGWVVAYRTAQSTSPLTQAYVFNDDMDASLGGIWMAGSAPVIDGSGNLYYITGNGDWNGTTDFGQSIIKLSPSLKILDYFTPDNWKAESNDDVDLGCGGLLLFPNTNFLLGGSKQGILYLTNINNMGHMVSGNTQIPQLFQAANGHIHSGPTYYNSPTLGPLVYIWSESDYLKAFSLAGSALKTTPVSKSTFQDPSGMPGAFMTVSANGSVNGSAVLWANVPYSGDASHATVPGVLRAFNPNNVATELWDSHMNAARDDFGNFAKDVPPVVANGRVYMATFSNAVAVYGLLSNPSTSIQISAGGSGTGTWHADTDYTGGKAASTSNSVDLSGVTNPAPTAVYQNERWGPATYTIPGLKAGQTYNVRLHFNEFYWYKAGQRIFNVAINGTTVLSKFDIVAAAGKPNKAITEQFQATANSGGQVVISLTNGTADNAKIDGIEVSNNSFLTTTTAINAGGSAAGSFSADTDFSGGVAATTAKIIDLSAVSNPAPMSVYQSERWGPSTYTIPGLTAGGQYTVRLHFSEFYWTAKGQRLFNVAINGATVLSNFDILATAGAANKALVEQFTATANSSGQIQVSLTNGTADNAKIDGIEVR
jgi:hypothetical protein